MNIDLSANLIFIFSILIDVSNFEILPSEIITEYFFKFEPSEPFKESFDSIDIF